MSLGKPDSVSLRLTIPLPPSFKNNKISGKNPQTGKLMSYTDHETKERMQQLEDAILFELYSTGKTFGEGTEQECLRRFRTFLSGLLDDSLNELPEGGFSSELVSPEREGITIIIREL